MDSVSPASGLLIAKAMAANEAIADRFERGATQPGETKAVLNAAFQVLAVVQDKVDDYMKSALPQGVGGSLDVQA